MDIYTPQIIIRLRDTKKIVRTFKRNTSIVLWHNEECVHPEPRVIDLKK